MAEAASTTQNRAGRRERGLATRTGGEGPPPRPPAPRMGRATREPFWLMPVPSRGLLSGRGVEDERAEAAK